VAHPLDYLKARVPHPCAFSCRKSGRPQPSTAASIAARTCGLLELCVEIAYPDRHTEL
jgi:hypothetical protein